MLCFSICKMLDGRSLGTVETPQSGLELKEGEKANVSMTLQFFVDIGFLCLEGYKKENKIVYHKYMYFY